MKIITTHPNADLDSFGGIVALKVLHPDAYIFFPGATEMALKNLISLNIYKINEISLKEIEKEEIEKIFVVDLEDLERLGKLYEIIIERKIPLEIYDHHPEERTYPPWAKVFKKNYGAVSTLLTQILISKNKEISPLEASLILLGIYEDTGSFHFQETTPEDFQAASYLLSKGANINLIHRFLIQELTPQHRNIFEQFYNTREDIKIKDFVVTFGYANLSFFVEDIAFVVHRFIDIMGIEIFFGFVEQEGKIYLIGRSRNEKVNLSPIFKELKGGGHGGAGSAILKAIPYTQAKATLITLLTKYTPSPNRAEDIMNPVVYFLSPNTTIEDALKKMNYYHINGMPVVSRGKPLGAVTRQLLDRALSHNLGRTPVKEIMDPQLPLVDISTPLEEFKNYLTKSGKRFILVMNKKKIAGIITRMDIYRKLIGKEKIQKEIPQEKMLDIKRILIQYFPKGVIEKLKEIGEIAEKMDMKAYLVGGTVRDMLLGYPPTDVDVVIEGNALLIGKEISKLKDAKFKSHQKFLTGSLTFPDGIKIDLATARKERYWAPAALPDVEASLIIYDLSRRDFTINTLIVSLNPSSFGKLYDHFGGLLDLKSKTLKVLHTLSFMEDPTRALRAIRLCEKLKFKLSSVTEKLIRTAINQGAFENLSGARLWEEFSYILELPEPYSAMQKLENMGLLKVLNPSIKLNQKIETLFERIKEIKSWAKIEKLEQKYFNILYIGALSINLKEEEILKLASRLNLNEREKEILTGLKKVSRLINFKLKKAEDPVEIYKALINFDWLYLFWSFSVIEEERTKDKIKNFITKYSKIRTEIKGKDLLEKGVKEGPLIGKALEQVLFEKIKGNLKNSEEELNFALNYIKNHQNP
ncbi:MAG: CBS domain-containing protein [Thermoanaerobaculia bacterium]